MVTCPNCGNTIPKKGSTCIQCGEGLRVGSASEPEVDSDYVCPKCQKEFDGWDCKTPGCGYKISEKRRRMVGKRLTAAEAEQVRKRLGIK